jgi:hypothetical protein
MAERRHFLPATQFLSIASVASRKPKFVLAPNVLVRR